MSVIDKELARAVRRIRNRYHAAYIINFMMFGLLLALCAGILLAIAARFIPFYNVYGNILKLSAAAVAIAFLYSSFRTPRDSKVALLADSMGLQERTITALELTGDRSAFAELEKHDALEHLKRLDYRKHVSLKPDRKYLLLCLIMLSVLALSGFIPNPLEARAGELYKLKTEIAEQQKKADRLAERVLSNPRLSQEQKKELEKLLKELKSELKSARDAKEIDRALARTEKKLEYVKDKYMSGDDLNKIAEVLSKNEMTKALADLIKSSDSEAFKENIRHLAQQLRQLSTEEKQKLAEELSRLAKELKNNPELSEAFAQLSGKLAAGELGDISSELSQLGKSISELMENESVRSAISQLARELGEAGAGQGSGQQNRQGQEAGGQQGQGNNPGNGNQPGNGIQPGGNGRGTGQGSGAGDGTNMGNEEQRPITEGSTGIGKKDGSQKKDGEFEKIYTPKTLGGEGDTSNLSGTKGTGGSTEQFITDKGQTVRGNSVPYNQVVGEYRDKAMESISTSDIPPGMKDMVKEYFTGLEE